MAKVHKMCLPARKRTLQLAASRWLTWCLIVGHHQCKSMSNSFFLGGSLCCFFFFLLVNIMKQMVAGSFSLTLAACSELENIAGSVCIVETGAVIPAPTLLHLIPNPEGHSLSSYPRSYKTNYPPINHSQMRGRWCLVVLVQYRRPYPR